MSSAICLNLDQSEILSSGNELSKQSGVKTTTNTCTRKSACEKEKRKERN